MTRRWPRDEDRVPTWFKVWFAVCAALALAAMAIAAWAVITITLAVTR